MPLQCLVPKFIPFLGETPVRMWWDGGVNMAEGKRRLTDDEWSSEAGVTQQLCRSWSSDVVKRLI